MYSDPQHKCIKCNIPTVPGKRQNGYCWACWTTERYHFYPSEKAKRAAYYQEYWIKTKQDPAKYAHHLELQRKNAANYYLRHRKGKKICMDNPSSIVEK